VRKKTSFLCFVMVPFALGGLLGCQGELKLNDGVGANPVDMKGGGSVIPANIGFADIYKDLDAGTGLGCTNQVSACHGGTNPTGLMALQDMSAQDMAKLMTNYTQVVARVDTSNPSNSKLLTKPLDVGQGGVAHVGGNAYFPDKSNPMYQRWLVWVQLGAKFESVPTGASGGN
jgi:hypothetical protein